MGYMRTETDIVNPCITCGYMILSDDKDIFNVNSVNGGEMVK